MQNLGYFVSCVSLKHQSITFFKKKKQQQKTNNNKNQQFSWKIYLDIIHYLLLLFIYYYDFIITIYEFYNIFRACLPVKNIDKCL